MTVPSLQQAAQLLGQGRLHEAIDAARALLVVQPSDALGWQFLGLAQLMAGALDQAAEALERSIGLNGRDARSFSMLGVVMAQRGQHADAAAQLDRAVEIDPAQPQLWYDRARVLHGAGRLQDALHSVDQALARHRHYAEAWLNRGNILRDLDRLPEALESLQTAAQLAPTDVAVLYALAEALYEGKRYEEAGACCARALALAPGHDGLWTTYGNTELELAHDEQAGAAYGRANDINPRNVRAWVGRSRALVHLNNFDDAVASLERAVAQDVEVQPLFLLELTRLSQRLALWEKLPPLWTRVLENIDRHESADALFTMLSHPRANAAQLLRGARACVGVARAKLPAQAQAHGRGRGRGPARAAVRVAGRRLRIGYLSADLRDHPVGYLMAGVLEAHDRTRFETVGIDIYPKPVADTPMRQRMVAAFDRFLTWGELSAGEIAEQIRALELDLLVDLMGATNYSQMGVLLRRPAPVQVAYLGFPGTSGMDEMDYIIGDRWVCPPGQEDEFSEHVVRLPEVFQANDRQRPIAQDTPTRASLGLPEQGFVFCCLNNSYKVLPRSFDIWMRLLQRVDGSVLWLLGENEVVRRQLRAQAQARGVAPERLVFAQRLPYEQYLAQYRQADLFLDTLPFNAGTTASDALWAGLPVLTQVGDRFAGRMAASLLQAIGLPELVTHSDAEYEALALQLATEPERLRALRDRLAANRLSSPLFNTERFTRHLEQALQTMVERHAQGLPPAGFDVPALPR